MDSNIKSNQRESAKYIERHMITKSQDKSCFRGAWNLPILKSLSSPNLLTTILPIFPILLSIYNQTPQPIPLTNY